MLARTGVALAMCVGMVAASAAPALAHDAGDTPVFGIVAVEDRFAPHGAYDDPFNGYRVYLSSPRHADSGSRGECRNPGREENVNGRQFNWRAANGNLIGKSREPRSRLRNLHARGYGVIVSPNTRDNGYLANRTASRNWGSDIHIVTHTNAFRGCNSSASYLLTMYFNSNDRALATELATALDGGVPAGRVTSFRSDLAELSTGATRGDAYVELQFHDNQATQRWLYGQSQHAAWRYGFAVDRYLNYP